MEIKDRNNKRTLTSVIATLLFHGIILLLLFTIGLKYTTPPPPEEGTEIDVGDLLDQGNALIGEKGGEEELEQLHDITPDEEQVVTQNTEDTPITTKQTTEKKPEIKQEKPEEINPNALFKKGKVKSQQTGGGIGEGSGSGIGDNQGTGGGGLGSDATGSGTTFFLAGRGSKDLSIPSSKTDEVGSIVVTIWVNPQGDVTRAVAGARGTTIDNKSLWRHCENAASKSKFTAAPQAPEEQKGTITYKFRR
ncbi:MAG: hypothetical protein LBM25_06590 [Bacteroidales bacterium]|jgi:hypothetical protein|nr:hypothetical protein [Bacteroidales bacterium]